jgi:hypothetical protein
VGLVPSPPPLGVLLVTPVTLLGGALGHLPPAALRRDLRLGGVPVKPQRIPAAVTGPHVRPRVLLG